MVVAPAPMEGFRPLRRVEFDKLVALGVFDDERVELLDGVLVTMSPIGPPHCSAVDKLAEILLPPLLKRARVRVQNALAASDISEPQPDLLVAELADYRSDHPSAAHLIIEVADSSLAKDRGQKLRIYAELGTPEYWIVNVGAQRIEVYRDPSDGQFRNTRILAAGESIQLLRFPDVSVAVDEVFGP